MLLLDGDDVLKLLKLSTQMQQDIEKAARVYGAVVSSDCIGYCLSS